MRRHATNGMRVTRGGVIHAYREHLPLADDAEVVTLFEGNTPLLEATQLGQWLDVDARVYLKCEGANPTGSFKDRGMTVAITAARQSGSSAVICASTGNTSAAAAAYAARAGLAAFVVIPAGKIAVGKLGQAVAHGARVIAIDGNFDDALAIVTEIAGDRSVTMVNSTNPLRIQGQKTAAFEICDVLRSAPTYHFLPVGNAGNITAYWLGYSEYEQWGIVTSRPKMMGFQAEGAAPIVHGRRVDRPETVATAIRIGNPASWKSALQARDESGGLIECVTDDAILESYRALATLEGVFVEPAAAAAVAGLKKLCREDRIEKGASVVCTLTGHGLKDPGTATTLCPDPVAVPADVNRVRDALQL